MTPIKRNLLYIFRDTLLRLRITWNHGTTLTVSVGYHVDRTDARGRSSWDGSRCRKNTTHGKNKVPAATINKVLEQLEHKVDSAFLEFEAKDKIPSSKDLKLFFSNSETRQTKLEAIIKEYIQEQSVLNQWSFNTKRSVKQSLDNLLEVFGKDYDINQFDEKDSVRLVNHFTSKECFVQKHDGESSIIKKGLNNTTINRYTAFIRSFANWAKEKGYYNGSLLQKKSKNFKTVRLPVIYLTMEELSRFRSVKVTKAEKEVVEAFSFCCFSGLRYSDISNLRWSNIKDDRIEIVTKKTSDLIEIELNRHSAEILSGRNRGNGEDKVFHVVNIVTYNQTIKKIAQKAKIDTPVKIVSYSGLERETTTLPKWHFITSHTPRKTFITNALSLGISPQIVMKWTGHKSYNAMKPYIDIICTAKQENMALFNTIKMNDNSSDFSSDFK